MQGRWDFGLGDLALVRVCHLDVWYQTNEKLLFRLTRTNRSKQQTKTLKRTMKQKAAIFLLLACLGASNAVRIGNLTKTTITFCDNEGLVTENECRSAATVLGLSVFVRPEGTETGHCRTISKTSDRDVISSIEFRPANGRTSSSQSLFCHEISRDPLPVCSSGAFQPDIETYYAIQAANSLLAAQGDEMTRLKTRKAEASTPASAHWRFIQSCEGTWLLRNRETATEMDVGALGHLKADQHAIFGKVSQNGTEFKATCESEGSSVFLESVDGKFSPRDCCSIDVDGFLGKRTHFSGVSPPKPIAVVNFKRKVAVNMASTHVGEVLADRVVNKCVKKSRKCRRFGADCVRISRKTCGFLDTNHAINCVCPKTKELPQTLNFNQTWMVVEPLAFQRTGGLENPRPALESQFSAKEFISNNLASTLNEDTKEIVDVGADLALEALSSVLPVASTVLGILKPLGLDLIFGTPPDAVEAIAALSREISSALNRLASDIQESIENAIDDAFIQEQVNDITTSLSNVRLSFLVRYVGWKRERLALFDKGIISRDELLDFPLDSNPGELALRLHRELLELSVAGRNVSESNAKLAAITFDLVKLGWVEALTMFRESVILKAYTTQKEEPTRNSGELCRFVTTNEASGVDIDATNMIQSSVDMILNFLKRQGRRSARDEEELEFDIRSFSYQARLHLEAFESFLPKTEALCVAVLTSASVRDAWRFDTSAELIDAAE